ncbi:uncharacterized protein LOC118300242 isoform X2 [Scophthalmus maximus]|uniref:uncharacterized protein LOC118300242 isoform X2 n=1 Tax=Scophthalmus maximus TaxID=52904 RepID=UPI0015E0AB05|nr:uncharacterized protein LOC118300242 isoform X2 [Scophthalmus maximus]XP_035482507.1 uncharacterized protein LOC118300242 isoform X2 [Scophthalmus maximus]XP_035483230.1 uncharacterized protein LOC118300242 isoform X2 [Scophthalmus maximus]XP_035484056.1 uncharacterized protein LOC118300242 isoform X2 [Scophthalmus maximus]
MAKIRGCSVVGCRNGHRSVHILPPCEDLKTRWIHFIFNGDVPKTIGKILYVCSNHFTSDCFSNQGQYKLGLASQLKLKSGSVPTVRETSSNSGAISPMLPATVLFHDAGNQSQCYILQQITVAENVAVPSVAVNSTHSVPAIKHVACQTDPPERKSAGTQLSLRTLQNRIRSRATQTTVASKDCGVCTLTFPLDSPMLFLQPTIVRRPSKRPRLSLTDEEDGPSECSSSIVVHEPKDST